MLEQELHIPRMAGRDLFRNAVTKLPEVVRALCARHGVTLDDVDWFLAHQANDRINGAVRDSLGVPAAKVPSNIARYGNTSGATIPILVDELHRGGPAPAGPAPVLPRPRRRAALGRGADAAVARPSSATRLRCVDVVCALRPPLGQPQVSLDSRGRMASMDPRKTRLESFEDFQRKWHGTSGGMGLPDLFGGFEDATRTLCATVDVLLEMLAERGVLDHPTELQERVAERLQSRSSAGAAAPTEAGREHDNPARADARDQARVGLELLDSARQGREGLANLMLLMRSGSDRRVRLIACEYAGRLGDDALIPIYQELTADVRDPALYGACLAGLLAMWARSPLFDTYSEKAYRLTLRLIERRPRTKDSPPWSIMMDLMMAFQEPATSNKYLEQWLGQATWFKAADLRKTLGSVVGDLDAHAGARRFAADTIVALGAPLKELEALRARLGAAGHGEDDEEERELAKKLDEAIATARAQPPRHWWSR